MLVFINGKNEYVASVPKKHKECFIWCSKDLRDKGRDVKHIKKAVSEKVVEVLKSGTELKLHVPAKKAFKSKVCDSTVKHTKGMCRSCYRKELRHETGKKRFDCSF